MLAADQGVKAVMPIAVMPLFLASMSAVWCVNQCAFAMQSSQTSATELISTNSVAGALCEYQRAWQASLTSLEYCPSL